jgi:hypothetical protein
MEIPQQITQASSPTIHRQLLLLRETSSRALALCHGRQHPKKVVGWGLEDNIFLPQRRQHLGAASMSCKNHNRRAGTELWRTTTRSHTHFSGYRACMARNTVLDFFVDTIPPCFPTWTRIGSGEGVSGRSRMTPASREPPRRMPATTGCHAHEDDEIRRGWASHLKRRG